MNDDVITEAHIRMLERAAKIEWPAPGVVTLGSTGFGRANQRRMMEKLCKWGYFKPYLHGGFEITEKGRQLVRGDI